MELKKTLIEAGLGAKEAEVYLSALALGPSTASEIAKSSGFKRPTVYVLLERLKVAGLASSKQNQKTTLYNVVSPKKFFERLSNRVGAFEKFLPDLESLYKSQLHRPKIQVFEGVEGVRQVYAEIEGYANKPNNEVLYFGSFAHYQKPEFKDILNRWLELMKIKNHHSREISDREEIKKSDYLEQVKENKNPNQQIRIAPPGIKFVDNENLIYGNTVALFSLEKEVFVVKIESEAVVNSMRMMFDLAWRQCKKV